MGDTLSRTLVWLAWILVAIMMLGATLSWWAASNAPPPKPPEPPSAAQLREERIQSVVDRGGVQLVAHIKAHMGDPDSFELVDNRYVDGGDHITLVVTYRGRNGFNALRLEKVGAAFDLRGNIISIQEIE